MLTIFIVSDGSGETAERFTNAALTQFGDAPTNVVRYGEVRTAKKIRQIVSQA